MRPEIIAAFLSFCAAAASAWAAWTMPKRTAEFVENLKRKNESENHERLVKQKVFEELMAGRTEYYSEETVRALNTIDVLFYSSKEVREAWGEFLESVDPIKKLGNGEQNKCYRKILVAIAKDIGLSEKLGIADFERYYFPDAIAKESHIRAMERERKLALFQNHPSANSAPNVISGGMFPPAPK